MHRQNFVHTRIHPASIRGLTKRRVVLSRFTYIQEYKGPGSVQSFPIRKSTEIHYFSPERFRQISDTSCLSEEVPGLNYSGTSRIPPEVGPWDGKQDDVWGFAATVIPLCPLSCNQLIIFRYFSSFLVRTLTLYKLNIRENFGKRSLIDKWLSKYNHWQLIDVYRPRGNSSYFGS